MLADRPGSQAFNDARSHLPMGPASVAELFQWPEAAWRRVQSHTSSAARTEALRQLFDAGIVIFSDHSGTGNGEGGIHDILQVTGLEGSCVIQEASDSFLAAQRLLVNNGEATAEHVFGDIMCRFSARFSSQVLDMAPGKSESKDKRVQGLSSVRAVVEEQFKLEGAADMFEEKSFCFRHRTQCPIWRRPDGQARAVRRSTSADVDGACHDGRSPSPVASLVSASPPFVLGAERQAVGPRCRAT